MAETYKQRRANAFRIRDELKRLKGLGYMIFDEWGTIIGEVGDRGFWKETGGFSIDNTIYFEPDKDLDNGACTPIAEFNEMFKDWRVVDPKDLKPLNIL